MCHNFTIKSISLYTKKFKKQKQNKTKFFEKKNVLQRATARGWEKPVWGSVREHAAVSPGNWRYNSAARFSVLFPPCTIVRAGFRPQWQRERQKEAGGVGWGMSGGLWASSPGSAHPKPQLTGLESLAQAARRGSAAGAEQLRGGGFLEVTPEPMAFGISGAPRNPSSHLSRPGRSQQ